MLETSSIPAGQPASASLTSLPLCIPLGATDGHAVGGKAAGLTRLIKTGLPVPPGFVVVNAVGGNLPPDLADHYRKVGPQAVAVRSSALGEDSATASYAGQYISVLDVRGEDALRRAVEQCLASLVSARADAYRQQREGGGASRMSVVVQAMVEARTAGVVFTADPLTGRRDRLTVDAVRGCGEALVSGQARPDHYQVTPEGEVVKQDLADGAPILSAQEIKALVAGARTARDAFGCPLDLEWAIARDGRLFWLQARPITALPADPHEFDTPLKPASLYTTANIGECMPGPITPLSMMTVWTGDDHGLQYMQRAMGLQQEPLAGYRITRLYLGHLSFDLHAVGKTSTHILGASDVSLGLAICGRVVPELDSGKKRNIFVRIFNSLRYVRYILSGKKLGRLLEAMVASLRLPEQPTAAAQCAAIDAAMPRLMEAFDWHIASSAGPGALEPALMQSLAKGALPTEEHHAQVAAMLAAESHHDVESADVVAAIDRLVALLQPMPQAKARFLGASPAEALQWLTGEAGEAVRGEFAGFLDRHGHHCLRELELREKEWAADPLPVVESLQATLRARLAGPRGATARPPKVAIPRGLGWLVRMTQAGVARREHTKSLLVKTVTAFKRAYRHLGELLAREARLPDADLVFFLTPEELRRISGEDPGDLASLAASRRRTLAYQMTLRFPDVFKGSPEPLGAPAEVSVGDKVLHGKPVSRGTVSGVARVALSLREASALQPGEILISPVTDIGWSPYFALIAGLATDIGSSVSHGAVVAREYGLPAVVDLRQATRVFKTGDRVVLDGDRGILRLADPN